MGLAAKDPSGSMLAASVSSQVQFNVSPVSPQKKQYILRK